MGLDIFELALILALVPQPLFATIMPIKKAIKYLDNSRLDENIFDIGEIERIKKRFFDGVDIGTTIWFILMYQMWKEKWLD